MKIKECIQKTSSLFNQKYNDIKLSYIEAKILLCYSMNITETDIITKSEDDISKEKEIYFFKLCKRRLKNEPIAYIIQKKEFYDSTYYVDKNVLIPRPETEELIDIAKEYIKPENSIIDIGTGSGIIAITIKKLFQNVSMTALDISSKAMKVAKKNAGNILGDANNIEFIKADATKYIPKKKYDIILSNPPYVALSDKKYIARDLNYEPKKALFAGANGMIFYEKFFDIMERYSSGCSIFLLEIGYNQGKEILSLCEKKKVTNAIVKKDLSNNDRFILFSL